MSGPESTVVVDVWIPGEAVPQGSLVPFVPQHPKSGQPYRRKGGSIIVNQTHENAAQLKKFRRYVATVLEAALCRRAGSTTVPPPVAREVGVVVRATFCVERPESHYRSGRNAHLVSDGVRAWPTTKPDLDKLVRAVGDAMTGLVYEDDSQTVDLIVSKRYAIQTAAGDGVGIRLRVDRLAIEKAGELPEELRCRPPAPGAPQPLPLA